MRKILPILLALAMVLTLLPVSAFAVGTDRTQKTMKRRRLQTRMKSFGFWSRPGLRLLWRLPPRKAPPTCRLLKLQP